MFNILPDNLKTIFFNQIKKELNQRLAEVKDLYEILFVEFNKTDDVRLFRGATTNQKNAYKRIFKINDLVREKQRILSLTSMPYSNDLTKFVDPDVYNKINEYNIKIKKLPDVYNKIRDYYNRLFSLLDVAPTADVAAFR
jgi:hypothetical protein